VGRRLRVAALRVGVARLDVPGETYVMMTLAVVGFLGSLIAPFHVTGIALDRARERGALARA